MPITVYIICAAVSLFTREWIEIAREANLQYEQAVSLFTREWIEILLCWKQNPERSRLPLYEGVD